MGLFDQLRARFRVGGFGDGETTVIEKISNRPDLSFRQHILTQSANFESQSLIDSYAGFAAVYRAHVWVRKAITAIANNVGGLPVRVVAADDTVIDGHELTELFTNPNDQNSQSEIWESYVVDMMLGGESFFEIVDSANGRPLEIWPRRPDRIMVAPDQSTERKLYPRVAGYKFGDDDELIPPENMIHDKFKNPLNPWRGIAPITAVRSGLVIDMYAAAWSKTFLQRGARPDYAIIAPGGITPTEREELESALMTKFSGSDNWHKPIILEEGVTDLKPFSFPPKDIEWLEQRKFARDEIGGVFGVPDEVMGFGRDTYENMDSAHRWFWLLTLIPLIQRRDDRLTLFFQKTRPLLKPGERFKTELSSVTALQEDIAPLIESARALWSMGVPFNAIDERLNLGFGAIPGGEIGYLPFNLIPAESAGSGFGAIANDNVRQINPETPKIDVITNVIGNNGQAYNDQKIDRETAKTETTAADLIIVNPRPIIYGSDVHKSLINQFERRKQPHSDQFQRELKRLFQRQQNDALRAIRNADGIPTEREIFDLRSEIKKTGEMFKPNYESTVDDFGTVAVDDALENAAKIAVPMNAKQPPADFGLAFDVTDPEIQAVINQYVFIFGRDINQTTQQQIGDALRPILDQAATEGWSIPQIQQSVYSEISMVFDIRKSDWETERIARTEINRAANGGTLAGWRQSGVVRGKAWLAALDARTRDSHLQAHDTYQSYPIPVEQNFRVGGGAGPAPGQIGIAGEDINCRCTIVAIYV